MKRQINKANIIVIIKCLLIGLFIIIITFPENDWTFSVGINPSIVWLFNYTFRNGFSIGKDIIFPHGPLSFFTFPLQENIIIATLAISLLKLFLVINLYFLQKNDRKFIWIITIVVAYIISIFAGFSQLVVANIILLFCNYYIYEKNIYKISAFILIAFSFYINSYNAVISILLGFSFLFYYSFFKNKNLLKTGLDVLLITGCILFFWFLMYGNFSGFIVFLTGLFNLAQDNSNAAALYPYNNWWFLTFFLFITFSIPFINKTKRSVFFGILISLSLFAAWKHGMVREDFNYVRHYFIFIIISLLLFLTFYKKNILLNMMLSIISIYLLSINMKNSIGYYHYKYDLYKTNNFIEFITDFSEIKNKCSEVIKQNIIVDKLPASLRDSINNTSVDIYPWDYSIIPANDLSWQPRPVLQSYASYTHWLDNLNSKHFNSEKAPGFIIWKFFREYDGSAFDGIDNRYVLNDEPLTIISIIENYKYYYSDDQFLILKKRIKPAISNDSTIKKETSEWGKWIDVPKNTNSLLRVKLNFNRSFLQTIKSFLYKDEEYSICLKLSNDTIFKYRIIPNNAEDGIWITPYIYDISKKYDVKQIMFNVSNQLILSEKINIEWERIYFNDEPNCLNNFFKINAK
ncbi:MAG TPA: hypothetical protein PKK00_11650 [Bacteroidales bacterium]|nr:hypothetical protein [Bacteroidales bacterium]HPS17383.1 hypothetical protein [Bacteroidales bacterium]